MEDDKWILYAKGNVEDCISHRYLCQLSDDTFVVLYRSNMNGFSVYINKIVAYKPIEPMKIKSKSYYWCLECHSLVKDEYHRCEQWSHVVTIPEEAVQQIMNSYKDNPYE